MPPKTKVDEGKKYWEVARQTREEVSKWPAWKREYQITKHSAESSPSDRDMTPSSSRKSDK
jgi:hypothetical protein